MSKRSPVQTTLRNMNGRWVVVQPVSSTQESPDPAENCHFGALQDKMSTSASGKSFNNSLATSQRKRRTATQPLPVTQAKKVYLGESGFSGRTEDQVHKKRVVMERDQKPEVKCNPNKLDGEVITATDETIETNPDVAHFLTESQLVDTQNYMSFILPAAYQTLLEKFDHLDTVVRFLFNRKQKVIWKNIKKSVEMMGGRSFTLQCLAQIRYIFPKAYNLEIQKGNVKNNQFLVITPNLDSNANKFGDDIKMTNSTTTARSHQFRCNLVSLMKYHHQNFLSTECPQLKIDGRHVKRWHTKFVVADVPDIPLAHLPTPSYEKCDNSARWMFDEAEKRIERKIELLMREVEGPKVLEDETNEITNLLSYDIAMDRSQTMKIESDKILLNLKGIPQSLIEKIREKEKLKRIRHICENDVTSKLVDELYKLPELAQQLQTIFTCQKKTTLPMDFVQRKLVESSRNITATKTVDAQLRLLVKTSDCWISIIPLRDVNYVRINRSKRLSDVISELKTAISNAQQLACA